MFIVNFGDILVSDRNLEILRDRDSKTLVSVWSEY